MKGTAALRRAILARRAKVGIVGQGYVGVSLAAAAAESGFSVVGTDLDSDRVELLSSGNLVVAGVNEDLFRSAFATERLTFGLDPALLAGCSVIAICVPTPIRDHAPDLSHVERAALDVAANLQPGSLVVLESTTYPGTTEEFVLPLLERSGLRAGREFLLAYSPERIDPGNVEFGLRNTPKIVGGLTPESTGLVTLFYEQLVDKVVVMSSSRAAELAKLLENTFRHVNIALVNELAMFARDLGVDVWRAIDAASTKPFGYMRFTPGPGVGGHCLPIDPSYLAWRVKQHLGHTFRFVELANDVNEHMPDYVFQRITAMLNKERKSVNGSKILLLGLAYKKGTSDWRESPSVHVADRLAAAGADVTFCDPYIAEVNARDLQYPLVEFTGENLSGADLVVMLVDHDEFRPDSVARLSPLVLDTKNALRDEPFTGEAL